MKLGPWSLSSRLKVIQDALALFHYVLFCYKPKGSQKILPQAAADDVICGYAARRLDPNTRAWSQAKQTAIRGLIAGDIKLVTGF